MTTFLSFFWIATWNTKQESTDQENKEKAETEKGLAIDPLENPSQECDVRKPIPNVVISNYLIIHSVQKIFDTFDFFFFLLDN